MDEILRKRIERKMNALPDEMAYRVLDYIEFLESKYGDRSLGASAFQRIAEGVEDVLRAGRIPAAAIRGTMNAMDTAGRVMQGILAAGAAAVDELKGAAGQPDAPAGPAAGAPTAAGRAEPASVPESPPTTPTSGADDTAATAPEREGGQQETA